VVLPKLSPDGIFVTQSGPAGILSCKEVFACIHATIRSVFPTVVPYSQHIPSFCDIWGYNMAFKSQEMAQLSPGACQARRQLLLQPWLARLAGAGAPARAESASLPLCARHPPGRRSPSVPRRPQRPGC
jgi:predicted membrane-bound spermidine synthase